MSRYLVFLLEEESAKYLLKELLPHRIPDDIECIYLCFEGKQDLEKNIARKIRHWNKPDSKFVVLRDQDQGDCKLVKDELVLRVKESGKWPRSMVRISCRELESWVVGDWDAIAEAYNDPKLALQKYKAKFKNPDTLVQPINAVRAHVPFYQKGEGARLIGRHLVPSRNRSPSFQAFFKGLEKLLDAPLQHD